MYTRFRTPMARLREIEAELTYRYASALQRQHREQAERYFSQRQRVRNHLNELQQMENDILQGHQVASVAELA